MITTIGSACVISGRTGQDALSDNWDQVALQMMLAFCNYDVVVVLHQLVGRRRAGRFSLGGSQAASPLDTAVVIDVLNR